MVPILLELARNNEVEIFYTLMGKATALTSLEKNDEVVETYDEVIFKI